MRAKKEIIKEIRSLIHENKLSVYSIAKSTGVNRSTLQKALTGDRNLSLRQFRAITTALPITSDEKALLYNDYLQYTWTKERLENNSYILDILNTISVILDDKTFELPKPCNSEFNNNLYSDNEVKEVITHILGEILENNTICNLYIYIPFFDDFFEKNILPFTERINCKVSVIFDVLKNNESYNTLNLTAFKNVLPLLFNGEQKYKLHYNYIESYNYDKRPVIYPFHIIIDNKAILLNPELNKAIVISDKKIISNMVDAHILKLKNITPMNATYTDIFQCVKQLNEKNTQGDTTYSINYEPCISSFVPLEMYDTLISDDMPFKSQFLKTISTRTEQLSSSGKRFFIFNEASIDEFVEKGNIIIGGHPYLRCCTLEERKTILEVMLKAIDEHKVTMRAFSAENINVSRRYELTNVRANNLLNIIVYTDNGGLNLLSINHPFINQSIISFIKDIVSTRRTFDEKETKALFENAIKKIDDMIAENA